MENLIEKLREDTQKLMQQMQQQTAIIPINTSLIAFFFQRKQKTVFRAKRKTVISSHFSFF